ncbi:MAG TPA: hypothetical protein EYN99_03935 [Gemmatimonadetes bacterium]|jgi:phage shock protein A|nr:hypothetical protein [Gemmatimonadota bacterium]
MDRNMFDDLRAAFREAIENFNKELNRDEVPQTVDDLIGAMKNEVADVTSQIGALESQISRARDRMAEERREAKTCHRRAKIAHGIGDTETATVAAQYAEKHEEHVRVLKNKIDALGAELIFLGEEVEEMAEKVEEAQATRHSLSVNHVRGETPDSISTAE